MCECTTLNAYLQSKGVKITDTSRARKLCREADPMIDAITFCFELLSGLGLLVHHVLLTAQFSRKADFSVLC